MGLLSHIESGQAQNLSPPPPKKEGLLRENETGGLSFFGFVTKFSLAHCAVFTRCDENFIISNSIGFDSETILKSLSTADFWNGTIKKNDWTFFSRTDNSIVTILQFFSTQLKDKINFVGFFFSQDSILLTAYEKTPSITQDFKKISNSFMMIDFSIPNEILNEKSLPSPSKKISFDYKNAFFDFTSKYKSSVTNAIALSKINDALRMELEFKLHELSSEYINFTKKDFFEIECNVFSKNNITISSLEAFLNLNLKPILNTSVEYISYDD